VLQWEIVLSYQNKLFVVIISIPFYLFLHQQTAAHAYL